MGSKRGGQRMREGITQVCLACAIVGALIAPATLPALGSPESETVEIEGVVRRVGSEPLTDIVVTRDEVDYIVPDDAERVFEEHIGTVVRVAATVRQEELQTVDGSFTVVRHYLVDPVILAAE